MANEQQLNELLRFRPWPPGDPWVLVETILNQAGDPKQKQQILGHVLDAAHATMQANLKMVEGLRQVVGR
jgi:hypothetical protein